MKKSTLLFLFVSVLSISQAMAQITITESDLMSFYSTGANFSTSTAFSQQVDIGSPGGNNTWDFSAYSADSVATLTYMDPASTPFADDFSGASACLYFSFSSQDTTIESYSFSHISSSSLETYGSGVIVSVNDMSSTLLTTYDPPHIEMQFPLTAGSAWTSTDSMLISSDAFGPITVFIRSKIESNDSVDAYGTLILPGGTTEDALRLRQEMTETISLLPGFPPQESKSVNYLFITKSGQSVSVSSENTTTRSGTIDGDVSWSLASGNTGVADNSVPNELTLEQNRPNPFMGETRISYQVAQAGKVNLSVYDLSGRKIRTLVNSYKPAGAYQVVWNGRNEIGKTVHAGLYISRLQSTTEIRTMKMLMTK